MAGFQPAVKSQAKARIGMYGVGGSGKTMAALLAARGLVPGGRYALVDTEAGKSSAYADTFPFDTIILPPPYTPVRFKWCIDQAVAGAYDVVIFDGISPFWSGTGGILAIVDAAKKRGGGWSDGSPAQQQIVDAITGCPIHVIVTMRAKSDTVVDKENGKTTIKKIGMKYDQRDNLEYDLGWLLYLEHGTHSMSVEKTHMMGQEGAIYLPAEGSDVQPAEEFGKEIASWLGTGAPIPEPPVPPTTETQAGAPAAQSPSPASTPPTEPVTPPATPEAASAPQDQPDGDDGGLAEAAGATPAAVGPEVEWLSAEQRNDIEAKLGELKELKKDADWGSIILSKVGEWYGADSFDSLSVEQAGQLLERLETTRRKVVKAINDAKEQS